jgi:3'-5' exonuclease
MNNHVLVWDLETVPDLPCVARVNGLDVADESAARDALGEKFPKLPFHKVACIGVLIAERGEAGWEVRSLGAPHMGERSEADLLQGFADRIDELRPQLVTFNGGSFDMPVLRYGAMINRVTAPGLECRRYWNRYSEDSVDLCDALACYSAGGKVKLNDLCCALGFPGKPEGIDGSNVDAYVQAGRIAEVAGYCETDVVSTYRVWLVFELFRGTLTKSEFHASEENLLGFIRERLPSKPHLRHLLGPQAAMPEAARVVLGSLIAAT